MKLLTMQVTVSIKNSLKRRNYTVLKNSDRRTPIKVKLSLCCNLALRHEGLLGSGGIAPLIL
jgi:hypothetical protein